MYQVTAPLTYRRTLLPRVPSLPDLQAAIPDYAAMLIAVMTAIADRYGRRPGYPYVDTKLNLLTGEDFPEDDPLRGYGTVYGWIQGRALEALADHCRWLKRHPEIAEGQALLPRLEQMLREVSAALWRVYRQNDGHVFFFMTPDGVPFVLREGDLQERIVEWNPACYGYADSFASKGLYAAAQYLGDQTAAAEAAGYCRRVVESLWAGHFITDERGVDPQKGPAPGDAVREQGPYMIHMGTAAVLAEGGEPAAVEMGLRLLRRSFEWFVEGGERPHGLKEGDIWEWMDEAGKPAYSLEGLLTSNPGHALELTGLGLKFTHAAKALPDTTAAQRTELEQFERLLPTVLVRNFVNGFLPGPGGICLRVDLVTRRPLSEIMPWWSLPEAVRAAAEAWASNPGGASASDCLRVLSAAHNAFAEYYVRPDLHLMAYQTRSTTGEPVAVIPATADADPGYHTGASILDFLRVMDEVSVGAEDA
jgi:hypothetical protein